MFLLDDDVVYSASDLSVAAQCEFGLLRRLDFKLGRAPDERGRDAILERTAKLGAAHEAVWKARFLKAFGPWDAVRGTGVYEVEQPDPERFRDAAHLYDKADETRRAIAAGADVVVQGIFFDGRFYGVSDFLVKQPDGAYAVLDTKLARHAKVTAVLQLAAYGDQLQAAGIPTAQTVHLVLGDHSTTSHDLPDLLPLFRHRRARLEELLDNHLSRGTAADWQDLALHTCGRCELCTDEAEARRDLLLVAGLTTVQRSRLRAAGIVTIDDLAASTGSVDRVSARVLDRIRAQAALQVQQNPPSGVPGEVTYEVFAPAVLHALPPSSPGDIFFDFEGDPLWSEGGSVDSGLEYLFGWVETPAAEADPVFHALWAHDRAEEKAALEEFIAYVVERRRRFPDMHIFHYAPYETTALKRLVGRHGTCEPELDDLLRSGVFIDLFSTVRESLRVSQQSYSIKKLEPLYMESREGLDNAADSITDYAEACEARDAGDVEDFKSRLNRIGEYNYDDCRSTYFLREWLLARGAEHPRTAQHEDPELEEKAATEALGTEELVAALQDRAVKEDDPADAQALLLLSAALGYHWREEKPFWWAHFARLTEPVDEWSDTRDVFRSNGDSELAQPSAQWRAPEGRQTNWRRTVRLRGEIEPGSSMRIGSKMWPMYEHPTLEMSKATTGTRGWNHAGAVITDIRTDLHGSEVFTEESSKEGRWAMNPMALVPAPIANSKILREAVIDLSSRVVAHKSFPPSAALEILRRRRPKGVVEAARSALESGSAGVIPAITQVLSDLENSYVAVQGPPGTGKTFTGSRVLAELVARGWKIGVVAQSHAVVENFLTAVLEAGVDPALVGKKPATGDKTMHPWRSLATTKDWTAFLATNSPRVVGGTAWDFANPNRVECGELDLLVIDEAGQFSLANTLAVADSATRLLLLGDPQQLPQVSQGSHPFPVDESALGWLVDGHATMPEGIGFFLDRTFRMHPDLCAPVSDLSYSGRLHAMPRAAQRSVAGIEAGLHTVLVEHSANRTESPEEAEAVVGLVQEAVGRRWQDPAAEEDRALTARDVIVVAAYNAQVAVIRDHLEAAGLGETRVGTVDKFQGQEAAIAVVSLAASSAEEVPRGMDFLINRNRLNVAISRGKYAAYLVHSPRLRDYLPANVGGLEELGAFIGLSSRGLPTSG